MKRTVIKLLAATAAAGLMASATLAIPSSSAPSSATAAPVEALVPAQHARHKAAAVAALARPAAHIARGYPAPAFTYGAKDWNVHAESVPPAPGAKVVFYAFIENATRATWTASGFGAVAMHRGHWMFAPTGESDQEWDGYSSSIKLIHRFQSTRLDITLRMWDHSTFSKVELHWRCNDSGTTCHTWAVAN